MRRFLILLLFLLTACAPRAASTPDATATFTEVFPISTEEVATVTESAAGEPTVTEMAEVPAATDSAPTGSPSGDGWVDYANTSFGFAFRYPPGWFGPDEYISGDTLRLQVGSDVVYPYGTGLEEQVYTLNDAYYVTIQYTKNNTNTVWQEAYDPVSALQDGEALAGPRSLLIRIGEVTVGNFTGLEYISTLPDTAQTEIVYTRNILLFDGSSNVISIMGSPNNVIVPNGMFWRDAYRAVDEANAETFHKIVESIRVE